MYRPLPQPWFSPQKLLVLRSVLTPVSLAFLPLSFSCGQKNSNPFSALPIFLSTKKKRGEGLLAHLLLRVEVSRNCSLLVQKNFPLFIFQLNFATQACFWYHKKTFLLLRLSKSEKNCPEKFLWHSGSAWDWIGPPGPCSPSSLLLPLGRPSQLANGSAFRSHAKLH